MSECAAPDFDPARGFSTLRLAVKHSCAFFCGVLYLKSFQR